jgi:hypothetical protein
MTKREILAVYLTVIALLQGGLYFMSFGARGAGPSFYFDPRIGIDFWLSGGAMDALARHEMTEISRLIRWASAAWILGLGLLFTFRKPVIQLYVMSECLLSLPGLAFFTMVALANLSPSHGFSIGELFIPLIVFAVYTVVPLSFGIQEWRGR